MQILKTQLEPNGATLTGFLYEPSVTLPESWAKPAVLVFPGGAYRHCVDKEGDPIAMAYAAKGFNAFVLRYSVTGDYTPGCPTKPEEEVFDCALEDAKSAMRYLRAHAEELHIDPSRIATVGFSAGANLSATLNIRTEEKASAMILGYGAFDDKLSIRTVKTLSLYDYVDQTTPPAFLFATQPDATVPVISTLEMALRLHEAGVPMESHIFVTGDHGLALANHTTGDENPDVEKWLDMSVSFLNHIWSKKKLLWGDLQDKKPDLDTRCDILSSNRRAHEIIAKYFPEKVGMLIANPFFSYISFRRFAFLLRLDQEKVKQVEEELKALD
ncbi:MAG: alpha/beta hydrolase [Lachnospiraceae bacterium]|nr:alpha/beta hydrolase [Lachnospiraceae bacterium]